MVLFSLFFGVPCSCSGLAVPCAPIRHSETKAQTAENHRRSGRAGQMIRLFNVKVPKIDIPQTVSSRGYIRGYPLMWRFGDFLDKEKVTRRRLDTPKVRFVFPCRVSGTVKTNQTNKPQFESAKGALQVSAMRPVSLFDFCPVSDLVCLAV